MDFNQILNLAQAGGTAILLVAVWQLWQRLNTLTDKFLAYMEKRALSGDTAAQKVVGTVEQREALR